MENTKSQSGEREYSKNERAEKLVGKRLTDGIIIDFPCELDYHCPVCEYEQIKGGNYDERLDWSEYEGFIYCHKCNKDYPSCLCMPDKEKATKIYLDCIEELLSESKKEGNIEMVDELIMKIMEKPMKLPMNPKARVITYAELIGIKNSLVG